MPRARIALVISYFVICEVSIWWNNTQPAAAAVAANATAFSAEHYPDQLSLRIDAAEQAAEREGNVDDLVLGNAYWNNARLSLICPRKGQEVGGSTEWLVADASAEVNHTAIGDDDTSLDLMRRLKAGAFGAREVFGDHTAIRDDDDHITIGEERYRISSFLHPWWP